VDLVTKLWAILGHHGFYIFVCTITVEQQWLRAAPCPCSLMATSALERYTRRIQYVFEIIFSLQKYVPRHTIYVNQSKFSESSVSSASIGLGPRVLMLHKRDYSSLRMTEVAQACNTGNRIAETTDTSNTIRLALPEFFFTVSPKRLFYPLDFVCPGTL
jgi:hypothetical protein